ncbi:peptidase S9 [Capnocytophaga stomatis]|uniref:S9 family peptidase n=1 Tax=Capnocytophaga stomatis TaxID=1848904 RepID=UPI0019502550|nr:S9 family peptidase [Capnocytophaga stomatis]GIJ97598.1 peptidase S9 [Capnocytophaga stomatis]
MKNRLCFTLLFLFISSLSVIAQNKPITLEDIWAKGVFYPQRMTHLSAMKNTNQYTVLNYDRKSNSQQIDLYDFTTLEKVKTLFNNSTNKEVLLNIDSYSFSPDEKWLLIASKSEQIYRRSFVASYYLYNLETKQGIFISENKIQEPTFSPDGNKIAYAYENNLYIYDITTNKTTQITSDGKKNKIINGITDWVYEEEFSFVRAFDWNADGTKLAYIRFDESQVPEFSMDIYGKGLYPTQQVFKYPKAGEPNSKVSVHIYDIYSQKTFNTPIATSLNHSSKQNSLSAQDDLYYYAPRLRWTNDKNILSVQTLNRHQNNFNLNFINSQTNQVHSVVNKQNNTYVDISDNIIFLTDNSFLITSEKDGFNHIYHYNKNGKLKKQITKGNWEVTKCYGYDPKSGNIFYQSTENGSINRGIYSISLSGKNKKQLSVDEGTNNATFSPDFSLYINQFSSVTKPTHYTLNNSKDGKKVKDILDNSKYSENISQYRLAKKEFFELSTPNGKLNAYIIKPKDFDPNKKYPLLMYQYSGPGSQEVSNKWFDSNDFWHFLLTQEGYLIACVDGRGTGYKGSDFKKCTYKELGKYEVEDQIFAARYFAEQPYVDKNRIGIWGWSFGGFMSSNCLFQAGDVFKTAIAVAPVTSWRFYDTIYTERFMQTPQENPSGYDNNSPITHAKKLKGNYLIIHGTADDNVHVQNAMVLINQLIQLNKNFDWLIYPDKDHGIYGGYTRLQLYQKMTEYLLQKL